MADLFWSIATSYAVLSVIGGALVASLVVGHLPLIGRLPALSSYVAAARLSSYPMLALLAFLIGHRIADESADMREMSRRLEQARIDLEYSDRQLKVQKETADEAQRLRESAEAKAKQANQKVTEYEERLAQRPAGNGCNLDDGDVRSLRDIAR
jgi:hypothetical protein